MRGIGLPPSFKLSGTHPPTCTGALSPSLCIHQRKRGRGEGRGGHLDS
jgi:hypothetical protein